ncbi:hypothetical protein GUJ93_ZPchr0002g26437 [Zizania palustris]|uniref:USP domain-containing protein n=2 Tax=Zizania palustris TaxID=103762 RepID=A0A8J5RU39_ZIZPA|nr:hypothetical protein GUJ93_ZPchr0002g26437 [Zizania palustris]
MVSLLESMHKCCLPSGIPSESPSAYEKSLVHRIFGGCLRSQVRCTSCSHCSNKFDPFLDLSLEIANAATLVKALQNFTEEELLDGGEKQYNCECCMQKVIAKKRFMIDKAPSVLTIHLKRFSPFNPRQKIDKKVEFQSTLNLEPYVSNSEGMEFKYSLYGVLVHAGWNTQSGHYYCFVRTSSGIWHNLDDNQVNQVHEADVLRQKAYMLFYVRDRLRNSVVDNDNGAVDSAVNKMVPDKITCMNGAIKKGLVETTLSVSSFVKGGVNVQKQNSDSAQSNIISNAPQNQCSKKHGGTEVLETATSPNDEPSSSQRAPCICPDVSAAVILLTKTEQVTSNNQREITSPAQADVFVLRNASCNQKAYEKPSQEHQIETDDVFTHSGENAPAALSVCGVADGLLGANGQTFEPHTGPCPATFPTCNDSVGLLGTNGVASEPRIDSIPAAFPVGHGANVLSGPYGQASGPADPFCKPTPNISYTTAIAQIIPTEDTAVSNGTKSSDDISGSTDAKELTEFAKKYDEQVTMMELSAKNSCDIANTDEQTSVQNNTLKVGKDTARDTDNIASVEEQVLNHPLAEQVKSEKQICLEVSAPLICSEDSTQLLDKDPGNGNLHKKMDFKSKKHMKYPVSLFFGPKQLLLRASVKLHKKRKFKGSKRCRACSVDIESVAIDQQTSTSETIFSKSISHKLHRRKCSCAGASSEDYAQRFEKKLHIDGSTISVPMDSKDATLTSAELRSSCISYVANQNDSRNSVHANDRAPWHFNLLTRGLREITVPRWDNTDTKNTNESELLYSRTSSISFVLDEWDEEYDRGRRKKARKSKQDFSESNPFQEMANNNRSGQRM